MGHAYGGASQFFAMWIVGRDRPDGREGSWRVEFNIADLFESVVDAVGDREALVSGARRLTFAELDARANRLANALVGAGGRRRRSRRPLPLQRRASSWRRMLAAFKIRAVPININYRYVEEELAYLFANADVKALFVAAGALAARAGRARGRADVAHRRRRRGRRRTQGRGAGARRTRSCSRRPRRSDASVRARAAIATSSTRAERPACLAA